MHAKQFQRHTLCVKSERVRSPYQRLEVVLLLIGPYLLRLLLLAPWAQSSEKNPSNLDFKHGPHPKEYYKYPESWGHPQSNPACELKPRSSSNPFKVTTFLR